MTDKEGLGGVEVAHVRGGLRLVQNGWVLERGRHRAGYGHAFHGADVIVAPQTVRADERR